MAGSVPEQITGTTQAGSNIKTVIGRVVTSDTNEPAIGASVQLKGGDVRTITDIDGNFSINVSGKRPVLVISYIGMKNKEVDVTTETNITVSLDPTDAALDEVVVVGSGTQKKVSVTGAIASIKGSDLLVPSSNLSTAFAGRIAGVVARQSSGEPGSGAEF